MDAREPREMSLEELPIDAGGVVRINTPEVLKKVLARRGMDLSTLSIDFRAEDEATSFPFLKMAVEQVCAAGMLPHPKGSLPSLGARVEAMVVGGKPGPKDKYGTGSVTGYSWDSVFRTWRIGVVFDEPAGFYYGNPITGTSTFPNMVRVIGGPERLFSTMTPAEIEELYQEVRLQL